ncbi:MAG: DUF1523 family protein [Alphaproteobacteria bacterium]|nr:MAG: DUF1523 family protein [Alphaproteobacteria bacterium]
MRKIVYVKAAAVLVMLAVVAGFLHYTLPQHDIVRIVNTTERRVDTSRNRLFWTNAEEAGNASTMQDVYFIEAIRPDGRPMVYRNQDTGWGWPPYFKFDSSNVQAKARDLVSTKDNPQWVVITHYGWRNEFLSIYPNAIEVAPVDGPDVQIFPWFNTIFFVVLLGLLVFARRVWLQFRERAIDPVIEDVEEFREDAERTVTRAKGRLRAAVEKVSRWLTRR